MIIKEKSLSFPYENHFPYSIFLFGLDGGNDGLRFQKSYAGIFRRERPSYIFKNEFDFYRHNSAMFAGTNHVLEWNPSFSIYSKPSETTKRYNYMLVEWVVL